MAAPAGPPARRWHADLVWAGGQGLEHDVLIEARGRHFTSVTPRIRAGDCPPGTTRLPGLTLPGLANAHSHAFHRALRGTVQAGPGTFWTWRQRMYEIAARLDPDSYLALATATYAEMALAGVTCVGEFHYLHHGPGGARYADPNIMGRVLIEAAARAGIRITLLDACYLSAGVEPGGRAGPLVGVQARFGDGDAHAWADRAGQFSAGPGGLLAPHARLGAAVHSVRAVPLPGIPPVAGWAEAAAAPLHAHLSEQPAENEQCLAAYGRTPAQLFAEAGALGPGFTVVHATHLADGDTRLLGTSGTTACLCPTTEADLADGIGPARELAAAGCPISLGSDSQAVIDLLAEARWLELGTRLATGRRGTFPAERLAQAATAAGHACLGWPAAGAIAPGQLADLVTVALDSPRLAGTTRAAALESVMFAATAADVRSVVAAGEDIVAEGRHLLIPDVPAALSAAITPLLAG